MRSEAVPCERIRAEMRKGDPWALAPGAPPVERVRSHLGECLACRRWLVEALAEEGHLVGWLAAGEPPLPGAGAVRDRHPGRRAFRLEWLRVAAAAAILAVGVGVYLKLFHSGKGPLEIARRRQPPAAGTAVSPHRGWPTVEAVPQGARVYSFQMDGSRVVLIYTGTAARQE